MNKIGFDIGDDRKLKGKILDAQHIQEAKKIERGVMGWLLGIGTEKPGNVAGFAVVASFILFGAVLLFAIDTPSLSKKDALLIVAGFISLGLGFLFGRATS